jgi:hypothetical protein
VIRESVSPYATTVSSRGLPPCQIDHVNFEGAESYENEIRARIRTSHSTRRNFNGYVTIEDLTRVARKSRNKGSIFRVPATGHRQNTPAHG